MKLLKDNSTKQFTKLMGIVGASIAIAATLYPQINQPATAKTITQNPPSETTKPQNQLNQIDRLFVLEATQAGIAEIEIAKLALQKSQNNSIRQYAQQMIKDHTDANQELTQLATQKGITPPTNTSPKYQAIIAQLSQLSDANFDQAYKDEAGINGHMENLIIHSRQIQLGQDEDLKSLAAKSIRLIDAHLQMIDALSK
jgi:putative membrane protein